MGFNKNFVWGSATASYQVEGAAYEDGKGLNIWDVFCKTSGKIWGYHNGDIACDQYHKYKEDIEMMKNIGIKAYRFSVSWARVLPEGTGKLNEAGLKYYDNLVDELIANNITPYMTLYHWDLPYALHLKGGWMNPEISDWFYEYASLLADHFSDRVKHFFTINEPQCIGGLGYITGEHAPGLKAGPYEFFQIHFNLLKAHGMAVKAIREHAKQQVQIGWAPCGAMYYPVSESEEDIMAAKRIMFHPLADVIDIEKPEEIEKFSKEKRVEAIPEINWNIALFCDPVYLGKYPDEIVALYQEYLPDISEEDWSIITQPLDFHGQNLYNGLQIRMGKHGKPSIVTRYEGFPKTAMDWPVTPEALQWSTRFLYERYQKPIYITENGMSSHDWISMDGKIHDSARIDFMHRYLLELQKAADMGTDIAGYFTWSLMDNFEWAYGYKERFGIIYVDYETQKRIPKDSAYFYKSVIDSNGLSL